MVLPYQDDNNIFKILCQHLKRKFFAVFCILSPVTCHLSPVTCSLFPVTCHLFPVTCHLSPVTCHLSPVTCHLSPVTCHLSPVTCHLSPNFWCDTCVSPSNFQNILSGNFKFNSCKVGESELIVILFGSTDLLLTFSS
jgi:hypothetical protein